MEWLRDVPRLRAFLAVAEAGSFTRAAGRLGQTQPTVSTLVSALEERVGVALLERARTGVVLTAAGEAFRPHAEQLLVAAEEAGRAVDAAAGRERRHLRAAGGEVLVTYLLPPALAALRRDLPNLTIDLLVADELGVLTALRAGRVDVALLTDHASAPDVVLEPFADDELVGLVPADDPLARHEVLELTDLAGRTLVVRDAGAVDRRETEALLARAGAEPAERLVAHTLEATKRCVAAGLGVALVPGACARGDAGVVALPVRDAPRLRYCVGRRSGPPPALAAPLWRALAAGAST